MSARIAHRLFVVVLLMCGASCGLAGHRQIGLIVCPAKAAGVVRIRTGLGKPAGSPVDRNCDFELKNGSGFCLQGLIAGERSEPTTTLGIRSLGL